MTVHEMTLRDKTQYLHSSILSVCDEVEKFSKLIIKLAVSAASLLHALDMAIRILTDH